MKHPLWLVNSFLFALFVLAAFFAIISHPKAQNPARIQPDSEIKSIKQTIPKIDLEKIYVNDLFGTYQEIAPAPKAPDYTAPIPRPPEPRAVQLPIASPPVFLRPLEITLNGIIAVSDESENIAIIKDNRTLIAKNYSVNDKINDAQIIKILQNKIILVRANGQQETLYVNKLDAEQDQAILNKSSWDLIVVQKGPLHYAIDPFEFSLFINDLGQLIDTLNLTTVYQHGKSIGCRVGIIPQNSLGYALGLAIGDIIVTIDSIPATDIESRLKIYDSVTQKIIGQTISIVIMRDRKNITLTYELAHLGTKDPLKESAASGTFEKTSDSKNKIIDEQKKLAPTINELRKEAQQSMIKHGKRNDRRKQNILLNTVK